MDNFYHQCPPKMSDQGRHLTDFRSTTVRDEYLKSQAGIYRDDDFRLHLQQNATKMMNNAHNYHLTDNRCWVNDCVHKYPTRCNIITLAHEKKVYDSLTDLNTKKELSPYRKCAAPKHYRMYPVNNR